MEIYFWNACDNFLRFIVKSFNPFEMLFFCTPKLHLGVTAISTSVSAVVFLLVGIAGWYNLNINCNQNIHYTNKLSYLHFLGSCVGRGGIFFTYLPSFTNLISKKTWVNDHSLRGWLRTCLCYHYLLGWPFL